MKCPIFCHVMANVLVPILAMQFPLGSLGYASSSYIDPEWSLHKLPDDNATDHLVFETVHSLLQHWPNTRMRNGHNIVPGTIPKGTLLYHGSTNEEFPTGPEWISMDPEHSFIFCGNAYHLPQHGCWHLTLMATRPLKVIYFDGSSAAKFPYGSMDTQDLIAWGKLSDDVLGDEVKRIRDLCKWGKTVGVDGFVRMQVDFETMLCDFTAGVSVVSSANLVSGWVNRSRIDEIKAFNFEVINAGSWHNHFPGETRIQLDLSGLVSFYDIKLAPSLVGIRTDQERWDHRVQNVSHEDLSGVKSALEGILTRPIGMSSGINWKTLIQVIVDRYTKRLELTHYLLTSSIMDPDATLDFVTKVQTQLRIMLTPYIRISAVPPASDQVDMAELDWSIPIYKLCATTHTYSMESQFDSMTDSERLILQAVRGTSREICRVVTKMWAGGVYAGIDPWLNTKPSTNTDEIIQLRDAWVENLERLMAWLDWNTWIKCNADCTPEEMCYLPTWPIGFPSTRHSHHGRYLITGTPPLVELRGSNFQTVVMERSVDEAWNKMKPEPNEWMRPQPKCIRRVEPYEF